MDFGKNEGQIREKRERKKALAKVWITRSDIKNTSLDFCFNYKALPNAIAAK
jgi:hypothetical protein